MNATEVVTADRIEANDDALIVVVAGQTHRFPWAECSPRLAVADATQRQRAELSPGGYGIHWPLIDEDLSVGGLLRSTSG